MDVGATVSWTAVGASTAGDCVCDAVVSSCDVASSVGSMVSARRGVAVAGVEVPCCVSTLDSIVGVSSTVVGTVIEGVLTGAEVSEVVTAVEVAVLGDSHPLEFCQFSLGSTVMTLNSDSKSSAPNNREVLMRTRPPNDRIFCHRFG